MGINIVDVGLGAPGVIASLYTGLNSLLEAPSIVIRGSCKEIALCRLSSHISTLETTHQAM